MAAEPAQRLAYSIREASELSGRPQRTLRAKCEAGELGFRDGGRWYIGRSELYALVNIPLPADAHDGSPQPPLSEREEKLRQAEHHATELLRLLAELRG